MDDPNRERLQPVYPPENGPKDTLIKTPFQKWSFWVQVMTALCAVGILGFCGFLWAGFWENDRGIWHLLSALALCFGAGALAYGPLMFICFAARKAGKTGPKRLYAVLTILLVLPWMLLGGYLVPLGSEFMLSALFIWVLSLFLLFWAALNWHGAKVNQATGKQK